MFTPGSDVDLESIESLSLNERNKSQLRNLVIDLCSIHSDLCDTCSIASDYFSIKMLAIIGTAFLCALLNGYNIFFRVFVKTHLERKDVLQTIYLTVQTSMVILGVILATDSGHKVTEEV